MAEGESEYEILAREAEEARLAAEAEAAAAAANPGTQPSSNSKYLENIAEENRTGYGQGKLGGRRRKSKKVRKSKKRKSRKSRGRK